MEGTNLKQHFIKYVSLNVIGMIGLSCYILADTFFVARGIGADGLAALNLAIPVYSLIHGMGLMIGMGGATRFMLTKSKTVFTQALYYAGIIALFMVTAAICLADSAAAMLGADGDTFEHASIYLKTILFFAPMFLLNNVLLCFVRNDQNPRLSMSAMLIGSFSNVVLDYIFIFPLQMGMFGAALATGIAPVISLLVLSIHLFKKKNTFHLVKTPPEIKTFAKITSLGISALITELSSGIVMIVFNTILLNLEGNTGVAAYGIIANIALVVLAVFTGIAQGMQPMISAYYREQKNENIQKIIKYGYITAISIAILVYGISTIFAEPIVGAFNKDANIRLTEIAVHGLRIYFTAFAFVGINLLTAAYFSAIDMPKNAFIISMLRGLVLIVPVAVVLSRLFGINGVWISMVSTEFVVLLICVNRMRRNKLC